MNIIEKLKMEQLKWTGHISIHNGDGNKKFKKLENQNCIGMIIWSVILKGRDLEGGCIGRDRL